MARTGLKLCLCGSGGGHVRQLLDLEPVWAGEDYVFVTEDLILGRSIAETHPTRFVAHVALGQARLGAPFAMIKGAVRNLVQSARIVWAERPDVVITTGAGSMFFVALWARLTGARIVLIDSFARFQGPSAFARLCAPLAHVRIAQSAASAARWPGAEVYDPLRDLDGPRPAKQPLLFATVGATLPFDRLVRSVETARRDGLIPEHVIAQIGQGGHRPAGLEDVRETIPFGEVQDILRRADIVVCHGGTGSLITALREGCRVIAVPRLFALGEHYDDHQLEITAAFAGRGLLTVARSEAEFGEALAAARAATPRRVTTDPAALVQRLQRLLAGWARPRRGDAGAGDPAVEPER